MILSLKVHACHSVEGNWKNCYTILLTKGEYRRNTVAKHFAPGQLELLQLIKSRKLYTELFILAIHYKVIGLARITEVPVYRVK